MAKHLDRARQLGRMGEHYRDLNEAIDLYNGYIDECIELGTEGSKEIIDGYGQEIRARQIVIRDEIDRIKKGLPKEEAAFIKYYYYKAFSFSETCKALQVTQKRGAEIRRSALAHFDEIQTKEEEKLKRFFRGRAN